MLQSSRPKTLLHIDSSVLADHSVSRELSAALVEQWCGADATVTVVYRDLGAQPPAHLSGEILAAGGLDPSRLTDHQRHEIGVTEVLIEEFLAADAVVIGAPMYNFAISTQLRAWIDRIVQVGRTFRYTEAGPIGLAGGKRVVIVSSRGGVYATPERQAMDFQEAYLRLVFNFLGITDFSIIRAEGLAMGPEPRQRAITAAHAQLADMFQRAA
ncbi:NAD(P)H-dependent oxidoreductase [Mesorhizobium sp. AR02]|uniref:FMN-dependent NADH-azoreductase n=1 Tax=Mesorhizobium sp. AR02 TaxID=2865837 RepID=UPI00215E9BF8|nr:NAD(P)H-dependent oxidoreductase [Mesorhizobium sp. AR02]UVK52826.1 NAD(P)H-dependent oxidoreductase [Mesorhizobium sp. AR02]